MATYNSASQLDSEDLEIDRALHRALKRNRRLTFIRLADSFPQYKWLRLFNALNRLQKASLVELTPIPWDHEITVPGRSASRGDRQRSPMQQ